jgi:hypothetical protein
MAVKSSQTLGPQGQFPSDHGVPLTRGERRYLVGDFDEDGRLAAAPLQSTFGAWQNCRKNLLKILHGCTSILNVPYTLGSPNR